MLKGIIFDMDGVIIDSEPSHARAAINALEALGVIVGLDYPYRFIGSTTEYMLKEMIRDFNLDISLEDFNELYKRCLETLIEEEGYTEVPFVKKLIRHLHEEGYFLAIASSSTPEEIHAVTKALDISSCFTRLVSGATVPHPKPAPDVFIKAVSELGLTADECIIIEDSFNGVMAARAANIPVIGYVNPNSGNQDLSSAAILIEGFEEIDSYFLERTFNRYHDLPSVIAETPRLLIKEIPLSDIPALMDIYKKPAVNASLPDIYKASLDDIKTAASKHRAYIQNIYHFYGYGLWGVYMKETGKLIGQCGIELRSQGQEDEIELGYLLNDNYWHQGYGLEAVNAVVDYAFTYLDINRVTAQIVNTNKASIALAEKTGFHYVNKVLKNGILYNQYTLISPKRIKDE